MIELISINVVMLYTELHLLPNLLKLSLQYAQGKSVQNPLTIAFYNYLLAYFAERPWCSLSRNSRRMRLLRLLRYHEVYHSRCHLQNFYVNRLQRSLLEFGTDAIIIFL